MRMYFLFLLGKNVFKTCSSAVFDYQVFSIHLKMENAFS